VAAGWPSPLLASPSSSSSNSPCRHRRHRRRARSRRGSEAAQGGERPPGEPGRRRVDPQPRTTPRRPASWKGSEPNTRTLPRVEQGAGPRSGGWMSTRRRAWALGDSRLPSLIPVAAVGRATGGGRSAATAAIDGRGPSCCHGGIRCSFSCQGLRVGRGTRRAKNL
jgi:hypothetical protein